MRHVDAKVIPIGGRLNVVLIRDLEMCSVNNMALCELGFMLVYGDGVSCLCVEEECMFNMIHVVFYFPDFFLDK